MMQRDINYYPIYNEAEKIRIFKKKKMMDTLFFIGLFVVTILSLTDFVYSLLNIECRDKPWGSPHFNFTIWMVVASISSFLYVTGIVVCTIYLIDFSMSNDEDNRHPMLKIFYIIMNVFLLAWICFGFYLFSDHYRFICDVPFFNYYVWFRLTMGILMHLFFIGMMIGSFYVVSDREKKLFAGTVYTL